MVGYEGFECTLQSSCGDDGYITRSTIDSGLAVFSSYEDYEYEDESKILIGTKIRPIFRRSRIGVYYVYTSKAKSLVVVDSDPIQSPAFSPKIGKEY